MKPKRENNLRLTFLNVVPSNFPKGYKSGDPIENFEDPVLTVGLVLRFMVSICFADDQAPHTPARRRREGAQGRWRRRRTPIDLFELKALGIMAILLIAREAKNFEPPSVKPRLRRLMVTALYQSVLQHILWQSRARAQA
jgi:hypothetical protein